MACTATMTMTSPTQVANQGCNYVTTITNGGASPVDVVGIQIIGVSPGTPGAAPAVFNQPALGPNVAKTINAAASLSFSHNCVCFTPMTVGAPGMSGAGTYMVAVCTFSDGSSCITPNLYEYATPPILQQQPQVIPNLAQAVPTTFSPSQYLFFF